MGKKSKRRVQKEKKEQREALNGKIFKEATIDAVRIPDGPTRLKAGYDCFHGDPVASLTKSKDKREWLKKGSAIARFGQRYAYQSGLIPLNLISFVFLQHNSEMIDSEFCKIAYASSATEVMEGDVELARFKTELAITSEYFVEQGESIFNLGIVTDNNKPVWMEDMEATLDLIRKGDASLIVYLASKVPCRCLDKKVREAEQELKQEAAATTPPREKCQHGKPTQVSEKKYKEMQEKAAWFPLVAETSPRDFNELTMYVNANPDLIDQDFVKFAFAEATMLIVDGRKYEPAEKICNLALMLEVCLKHGADRVNSAIQHMEETNEMAPFLRDLYVELRKTNQVSKLLRLLDKKIPCDCLEDLRGIMYAEGKDQNECCDICFRVVPKSQLMTCARCGVEAYCSRECQEGDYEKHKVMCKRLASASMK